MRALLSGRWGDTYMLDIVIGGLKDSNKGFPKESVEIVTDGTQASERGAAMAAARHRLDVRPLDEGELPQIVYVFHDDLPHDGKALANLLWWNNKGVPIYHIRHIDRQTITRLIGGAQRRGRSVAPKVEPSRERNRSKVRTRS